ncbi:MAG TPA: Flp pilus assembly protein CpaB [Beijerinckiaceae bacterium]|nr:Flp pilus assembly protein CpaB [Beijerinckiaceae bacterium]
MRSKTLIMIGLALVFGVAAIFAGQKWLERQSSRLRPVEVAAPKPVATVKVVVAAAPLRFGTEVTRQHLREVAWPEGAVPKGAFTAIDDLLDGKTRRTALTAVEENEPLLMTKVTGPGQRASLAAVIDPGMKAITVRVNDVNGVAGFVLPGERVDVLLTRNTDKDDAWSDVLLQNVKVLAADQSADERSDKPSVVKTVTFEVSTSQAQKLTLAASIGSLSLALRAAGTADVEATQRVNVSNLSHGETTVARERRTTTVNVVRALKRQDYSVPVQPQTAPTEAAAKVNPTF